MGRGVATKFRQGWGTDLGESKPPTTEFRFLPVLRPFHFGNIVKSKKWLIFRKCSVKIAISGGTSPEFQTGGSVPPSPSGDAHSHGRRL